MQIPAFTRLSDFCDIVTLWPLVHSSDYREGADKIRKMDAISGPDAYILLMKYALDFPRSTAGLLMTTAYYCEHSISITVHATQSYVGPSYIPSLDTLNLYSWWNFQGALFP